LRQTQVPKILVVRK